MRRSVLLLIVAAAGCGEVQAPPPVPLVPRQQEPQIEVAVASAGQFLVADRDGDAIERWDTSGAMLGALGPGRRLDGAALDAPAGLRLGPDGALYVACYGNSSIVRLTESASELFFRDTYLEEPVALAFAGDQLVVLANDTANAVIVDANGQLVDELGYPEMRNGHDLTVGPDGYVYVATSYSVALDAGIQVWDLEAQQLVQAFGTDDEVGRATGLTFGPNGALYVADSMHDRVVRFVSGELVDHIVDEGLDQPVAIESGPDGWLYVVDRAGVHPIHPETGERRAPLATSLKRPRGLTFLP